MNVIEHIRATGNTVSGVCKDAGITRQTFYSVIKPGGNPKIETIVAIARATGLTPADIRPELAA
jgi:DNA-binding phage protein